MHGPYLIPGKLSRIHHELESDRDAFAIDEVLRFVRESYSIHNGAWDYLFQYPDGERYKQLVLRDGEDFPVDAFSLVREAPG